jgi:hypothetical protein
MQDIKKLNTIKKKVFKEGSKKMVAWCSSLGYVSRHRNVEILSDYMGP